MVHWAEKDLFIAHKGTTITYILNGRKHEIKMPDQDLKWKRLFLISRKARRLSRLDKAMIVPTEDGFVFVRLGEIYSYSINNSEWKRADVSLNCRNPMYNALMTCPSGIYLGEYGNANGIGKRILRSLDEGKTWTTVYQFSPESIRHIHCVAWDPYEKCVWVFTGDSDNECRVLKADPDFEKVTEIGSGSQKWRACHALFTPETVEWFMDCPLEEVHLIRYHRGKNEIEIDKSFHGPVWFAHKYDNYALAASAQEIGPSHKDKKLHLYRSDDMKTWHEIATFEHDGWPKKYFRFGTMTFSRGCLPFISCEGVRGLDGKSFLYKD